MFSWSWPMNLNSLIKSSSSSLDSPTDCPFHPHLSYKLLLLLLLVNSQVMLHRSSVIIAANERLWWTPKVCRLNRRSSRRHQVRAHVPITLLQRLQRFQSWVHTRTPWKGIKEDISSPFQDPTKTNSINWLPQTEQLIIIIWVVRLQCDYNAPLHTSLMSAAENPPPWPRYGADSPMMAIFDLANSMRIGPRSEDSKKVPCSKLMAWPAHSASLNSTKATGAGAEFGDNGPDENGDDVDGSLVCIRRRQKPDRLVRGEG